MVNANLQMMEKIKKGKKQTNQITINYKDKDYEFTIRELTNKEILTLQKQSQKGIKIKVDPRTGQTITNDVNMDEIIDSGYEKALTGIAYSLSLDEKNIITPEQIDEYLPVAVIDDLFKEISKINGLEEQTANENVKKVESFQ